MKKTSKIFTAIVFLLALGLNSTQLQAQDEVVKDASQKLETEIKGTYKKVNTEEELKEPTDGVEKKQNVWKTLSKITFKKEYDELMGFKIDKPVFSKIVKELEGKEVTIKGYIIPVEGYKSHTEFIFSAFPYNMCFFCGGAGPETVMEVVAKEPVKYSAEQVVLKGKLKLNADDINRLMYLMEDAILIE